MIESVCGGEGKYSELTCKNNNKIDRSFGFKTSPCSSWITEQLLLPCLKILLFFAKQSRWRKHSATSLPPFFLPLASTALPFLFLFFWNCTQILYETVFKSNVLRGFKGCKVGPIFQKNSVLYITHGTIFLPITVWIFLLI